MLNLVYAAGVIETPSRITRPPEWRYEAAPLKVRSETQYLQAYLSLGAPYAPSAPRPSSPGFSPPSSPPSTSCFSPSRAPTPSSRYHTADCFSFWNLRLASFKRSPAVLPAARLAKISSVLNPRRRHIRLRDEKILDAFFLLSFLVFRPPRRTFPRGYCSIGPTGGGCVYDARDVSELNPSPRRQH